MTTLESTPAGRLTELLRESFGFERFRPYQEDVCRAVTGGEDVLLVMPTGAGKSLCYQLPGLARGGTTLVISPLIALMEDQVAALRARGLRAERVHSGRPRPEGRQACLDYVEGTLDFLFIAPERLGVAGFPEMLARRLPALVAVDEAHCISQWGHDFRPDYRMLGERLPLLRPAPVIGMTATATPLVQKDICDQLGIPKARRFIHGFRRDNIGIELIDLIPSARMDAAARLLADPDRRPAIVYAPSRRQTEDLVESFSGLCRVAGYHAGMPAEQRAAAQAAFQSGEVEIIVATIAFGMGIDKADIRTVLHMAMPASVESYYQEIGRAGRDGAASRAVMLSGWSDRKTHEFFMDREYPAPEVLQRVWDALGEEPRSPEELREFLPRDAERVDAALRKLCIHGGARLDPAGEAARGRPGWQKSYAAQVRHKRDQLDLITQYAGSRDCRMKHLVQHFGDQEDEGDACGQCDVCSPAACVASTFRPPDAAERLALERLLADLRRQDGQSSGRLHQELFGRALDRDGFERLAGALVRAGLVHERTDSFEKDGRVIVYRRLFLTGKEAEAGDLAGVPMESAPLRGPVRRAPKPRAEAVPVQTHPVDAGLVEALRAWRLQESRRREVPAFCVLSNRTLEGIASVRPRDERALLGVKGVGPKVVAEFGDAILALVRERASERD